MEASFSNDVLSDVKEMVLKHVGHLSVRVYLFGSWARGNPRRSSDIDVAIIHRGEVTASCLALLREALEESSIPYRVDVVDLNEAAPTLVEAVTREGILWNA